MENGAEDAGIGIEPRIGVFGGEFGGHSVAAVGGGGVAAVVVVG